VTETISTPAAEATPAAPRTTRKPALPALTGVRTFLAANIMLFHFTPPHIEWITPIVGHGFVFVGFFLLISGFILSYNYGDRIRTLKLKDFYLARVARLYPVYLISLLISFPVLMEEFHIRTRGEFFRGAIMTPLLLQGWSPWLATFWNTVAWTLSTEAFLYVIFPFVMRWRWPERARNLVALGFGIWILGLIPHGIYMLTNPDGLPHLDRYSYGYYLRGLKFTPLPYVCTFLVGIVLGRLHGVREMSEKVRAVLAFAAVAGILGFLYLAADHTSYILMHGGLLTPLFAMLILGVTGRNPVASFFGWKPFVMVGEATLCIYLLHFNGLQMMRDYHLAEKLHYTALDPWASYVLLWTFSYLLYVFYENPARKWVLATFGTKKVAAA
jgi:peptidoglycan/LPS O-acetylase OafA/YrhL